MICTAISGRELSRQFFHFNVRRLALCTSLRCVGIFGGELTRVTLCFVNCFSCFWTDQVDHYVYVSFIVCYLVVYIWSHFLYFQGFTSDLNNVWLFLPYEQNIYHQTYHHVDSTHSCLRLCATQWAKLESSFLRYDSVRMTLFRVISSKSIKKNVNTYDRNVTRIWCLWQRIQLEFIESEMIKKSCSINSFTLAMDKVFDTGKALTDAKIMLVTSTPLIRCQITSGQPESLCTAFSSCHHFFLGLTQLRQ